MNTTTQWYSLRYFEGYVSGFHAADDIAATNEALHLIRGSNSKGATLHRLSDGLVHIASIRAHKTEELLWTQKTPEFASQE